MHPSWPATHCAAEEALELWILLIPSWQNGTLLLWQPLIQQGSKALNSFKCRWRINCASLWQTQNKAWKPTIVLHFSCKCSLCLESTAPEVLTWDLWFLSSPLSVIPEVN